NRLRQLHHQQPQPLQQPLQPQQPQQQPLQQQQQHQVSTMLNDL
ncbi:unnamed protein product, partial [Adineta steineri]